jgi:nucleolar protein 4
MDAVGEEGDDATTGDDEAEADDSEMDVDDDLEKQAYDDNIASDDDDDDGDDDGEDDGEDEYDDGEEGENLEQKSGGKKTPSEDVQEGCTVFMRDLAFDATQQNIKEALGAFGRVVMAVIVKDKVTGDSRGTAFAKFSSSAEASRCVEAVAKDNRAATVAGRPCRVDLAVDRAAATRLKAGANGAEAKDKRNLYLANEGLIVETKKHKAAMSDVDRDKRKRSQAEKKKKLLNPLYFVSAHRLSLRNIPKTLSDHDFKIMCLRAVKTGHERKLVTEEDMTAYVRAQGPNSAGEDKLPAPDAYKKCVKAAKVMLDLKKMKNGVPQSKRFGFVEFTHHAHALACLRELNNTPNVGKYLSAFQQEQLQEAHNREETRASRIIAEFTLENFNKVKLLASRKERQQKSKSEDKGHGNGEDDVTGKKRERKDSASHSDSVTPVSNKRQKGSVNVSTLNAEPARNATPQETRPKADKGDKAKLQAEKRKRADQKRKEKVAKRQAKKLGASPSVAEGTQASKKRKQMK